MIAVKPIPRQLIHNTWEESNKFYEPVNEAIIIQSKKQLSLPRQGRKSAEKKATGTKHGKTCNRCGVRENMQPVPSAGKYAALINPRRLFS